MALYYVVEPGFTYRSKSGQHIHVEPAYGTGVANNNFDPALRDCPPDWLPPIVSLRPRDQQAADALIAVRAPYVGKQLPGIGVVPENEQPWNP